MTKEEILKQVAERYRSDGYRVMAAAGTNLLPSGLSDLPGQIDLVAEKGGKYAAIEVKRRDQLYEIGPLAAAVKELPDWDYDLVVYPPNGVDDIPLEDGEPSPEYVESLLVEARRSLDLGQPRGAFLVAWSAIETAMRTAARREDLDIEQGEPRFVLSTLYSNGPMSYEDYERLRLCLNKRDRLVHGLPVDHLEPGEIEFMIESARHLLCEAPEPADA
jgi:hypothetical protein